MSFREFFTTNSWWGKLLGAFFGYLTGGAVGALFGILLGNFFDKGLANHFGNPHLLYHSEKRKTVQKIYFEATFSVMGYIAKADGRISEQEIEVAQMLMHEMQLNKEQKVLARNFFNEGKQDYFNLEAVLVELQKACRDNRELLKLFIDIQYRASQADGLSTKKIQALDIIFARLGFAPLHKQYRFYEDFNYTAYQHSQEQHKNQNQSSYSEPRSTPGTLDHAYALLEINAKTNKEEAKQAYRRLLSRNHPDKLIAKGLPEEMIKLANEKTQKIMKAYELVCKSKGW